MVKVEILSSPGCGKCAQTKAVLKMVVEELGPDKIMWRDVNILDEMDCAAELGVMGLAGNRDRRTTGVLFAAQCLKLDGSCRTSRQIAWTNGVAV